MEPFRLHFLLKRDTMDAFWRDVLIEALDRGVEQTRGPVAGAKLRQLVTAAAEARGLLFPPEGSEQEKFADFLKRFDSDLVVLRRKGRDLLVAPIASANLLLEESTSDSAQLRSDVFNAFTQIPKVNPKELPWYVPATDRFMWVVEGTAVDETQLKSVPPATRNEEISDRQAFLDSASIDEATRNTIAQTLATQSALWAFSQSIRTRGLAKKWHSFRFQRIVSRIRRWCQAVNVPWRESWISESDAMDSDDSQKLPSEPNQREHLTQIIARLSNEDLQRISVPLDLVLKIVRG
jgi:hypothetical protein